MAADALRAIPVIAILLVAAACDIPRDPRNTLAEAVNDTLHVGVTEARPWVIRTGGEPTGVEPALVRAFARAIDAELEWDWGPAAEHMEALSRFELDVAIGGFTRDTPWRSHVGLTAPYHTTRTTGPVPRNEHHVMAVPPGENRLLMALENALHGSDVEALLRAAAGGEP